MCHPRRLLPLLAFALAAPAAVAQDAVIFSDGYTIRGKHGKEVNGPAILDSPFDMKFPTDYLNCGAKWVHFSNNTKKGIELIKGPKEDKVLEYRRPATVGPAKMPQGVGSPTITMGEYNADGRRRITVDYPKSPDVQMVQVASHITPKYVYLTTVTHQLRQVYGTTELGPAVVRGLLANHPELRDGWLPVPDPMKRVKVAEFLLECGWRAEAKAELDKAKKDIPWAWPKEAVDKADQVSAAIDKAEVGWVLDELEVTVAAGQYQLAAQVLKGYQPKVEDKATLARLSNLKATVETLQPKYEAARKHLRTLIDELTVSDGQQVAVAIGGAPMSLVVAGKPVPVEWKGLIAGAEAVYAELHPDALDRIETFVQKASIAARDREAGRKPKVDAAKDLAIAVSAWMRGKGGFTEDPVLAAKMWNTRVMVVAYLSERAPNARTAILNKYQQATDALGPDEIAQIVSLLPPIDAENLAKRRGRLIDVKECGARNTYKLTSDPLPEDLNGVDYYVHLPPEYHHGRAYPVVVALQDPSVDAAKMIGLLAAEADRRGYILISPEWAPAFSGKKFDFMGTDHRIVTSAVRDAGRKFNTDPDRVFAFGFGQGGTLALDLAMSKPDGFAGVAAMSPAVVPQFYRDYAKNAQKLAVYTVTGELSPANEGLRSLYQNWLPYGYYALLSVYKGREADWFAAEVPTIFDWMKGKKRVRGLESLRMDGSRFDAWHTFRPGDDRFYWVGVSDLMAGNTLTSKKAERPDLPPPAASIAVDVINGDTIVVKTNRGVKQVTVWLERGMIAWDKEVKFSIDSGVDKLKPTKVTPDLSLMLEELYRTGDRKMLFFAKFEFRIK